MRIVGGRLRGRGLAAPPGRQTRPTSDRVREAVFNRLEHGVEDFTVEGVRVLDLFAGSGALGFEALSRGARFVLFVENSTAARGTIRRNADVLGLTGQVKIWRRDAAQPGRCAPMSPFALVFLDPPYGRGLAERALAGLIEGGWLAPGAVVVVEEATHAELAPPAQFAAIDTRRYGDTTVSMLRHGAST